VRALRTQQIGRILIAVTITTFICFTPPVFELVDRLAHGRLSIWIFAVWALAILGAAVAAERRASPNSTAPNPSSTTPARSRARDR
jgi:hypothetical protein